MTVFTISTNHRPSLLIVMHLFLSSFLAHPFWYGFVCTGISITCDPVADESLQISSIKILCILFFGFHHPFCHSSIAQQPDFRFEAPVRSFVFFGFFFFLAIMSGRTLLPFSALVQSLLAFFLFHQLMGRFWPPSSSFFFCLSIACLFPFQRSKHVHSPSAQTVCFSLFSDSLWTKLGKWAQSFHSFRSIIYHRPTITSIWRFWSITCIFPLSSRDSSTLSTWIMNVRLPLKSRIIILLGSSLPFCSRSNVQTCLRLWFRGLLAASVVAWPPLTSPYHILCIRLHLLVWPVGRFVAVKNNNKTAFIPLDLSLKVRSNFFPFKFFFTFLISS